MQLSHNANFSDADSFWTHSDGTNQLSQQKGEGKCKGKNADIGY